jgi:segregation and condensation protein B
MSKLQNHIESLVFVSTSSISKNEIKKALDTALEADIDKKEIEEGIAALTEKYKSEDFAFELVEISGGYQFMTKGAYHDTISQFLKQTNVKRLSKAAMETLSIIAYQQPIVKSQIEKIRGVSADYSVQKLLEKELIQIKGRSEGPGKPLLYATSEKFMDYFGLKSNKDLPQLKEIIKLDNTIGEAAPTETTEQNAKSVVSTLEEE